MSSARWGLRLVFAGACAQLIGAAWDAALHRLDPGRGAAEAPFSLANPGHLMFFLGIGLVVGGAVWASLVARPGRARGGRVPIPAAALLGLSLARGSVVLATGGGAGHPHPDARAGHRVSASDRLLLAQLQGVMAVGGLRAALDRFDVLAARNHRLYQRSHFVVHEIGRLAYARYGGVARAFGRCDRRFDGGCYHGVLQAHFDRTRTLPAGGLGRFCDRAAGSHPLLRFECVHGLGHGLFALARSRTLPALRYCDGLGTRVDRSHCYGGVFMEEEVSRQGHHARAAGRERAAPDMAACAAIPVRYRWQCYGSQAFAGLRSNGRDFPAAFRRCERAPAPYDAACHEGMGGVIEGFTSVTTRRGARQARALCMLAKSPLRGSCFTGLARNALAADWNASGALGLCRRAPAAAARDCVEQVGWVVPNLRPGVSTAACKAAGGPAWVRLCRRGARHRQWADSRGGDVVGFSGAGSSNQ